MRLLALVALQSGTGGSGQESVLARLEEPDWSKFQQFIHSEVRYTSLLKSFPDEAKELFAASEKNAQWRYETYKRYAAMDYSDTVEEK